MGRHKTMRIQRWNSAQNTCHGVVGVFGIFMAASGLILVSATAGAGEPALFGRLPAEYGRQLGAAALNAQRQVIARVNAVRQVADSRAAQTRIRRQLGRSWFATPQVPVQPGPPTPPASVTPNLISPEYGVVHVRELGFDAVANDRYGQPDGLRVVHVAWHGEAAEVGLEPGDMILRINGYRVHDSHDIHHVLRHVRDGHLEFVIRDVHTCRVVVRTAHLYD